VVRDAFGASNGTDGFGDLLFTVGTGSNQLRDVLRCDTAGSTHVYGTASIRGDVVASNATLSGGLVASSAVLTSLTTQAITVETLVIGDGGGANISGSDITASNGFFAESVTAASATLSGALVAGNASMSNALVVGSITGASAAITNGVTATSATLSGALNAGSANVTNALTATTVNNATNVVTTGATFGVNGYMLNSSTSPNNTDYYISRGGNPATQDWIVIHTPNSASAGVGLMTPGVNTRLFMQSSTGFVGIGTTTPSVRLDVAGNIACTAASENGVSLVSKYVLQATAAGRLLNSVRALTSGTTYAPTPGTTRIVAHILGGGGGGGGINTIRTGGGGGGAGGLCIADIFNINSATTYAITIGAGGTGGPSNGNGGTGGTTSLTINGTTYSGLGGQGGQAATASTTSRVGGVGGATTNSIAPFVGMNGAASIGDASANTSRSGAGASSMYGNGGQAVINSAAGDPGEGFGSGGSGAANTGTAIARTGGAGAQGIIVLHEYL
jgi:hypothetical protein